MNNLTWYQKLTLFTVGAAAAYKILLHSLGWTLNASIPVPVRDGVVWDVAAIVRVAFALLGFVAFDLVLVSVVVDAIQTWKRGGALRDLGAGLVAAIVAGLVSALMALQVADGQTGGWLTAAPAVTMIAYVFHLIFTANARIPVRLSSDGLDLVPLRPAPDRTEHTNGGVNVTIQNAPIIALPTTTQDFLVARAKELGTDSPTVLARACGTSVDTASRALRSLTDTIDQEGN